MDSKNNDLNSIETLQDMMYSDDDLDESAAVILIIHIIAAICAYYITINLDFLL